MSDTRIKELEEAIREHRRSMRRIFGTDYGKPKSDSQRSADAKLWKLLEDE